MGLSSICSMSERNPPHFHVWYKEYQVTVTIEDSIVKGTLLRRALNLVYEWSDLHKEELIENWKWLTSFESPRPIKPLE